MAFCQLAFSASLHSLRSCSLASKVRVLVFTWLCSFSLLIFALNTFSTIHRDVFRSTTRWRRSGLVRRLLEEEDRLETKSSSSVSGVLEVRVRLMSLSSIYQFSLILWNVFLDRYLCETGFLSIDFSLKMIISQVFAGPSSSGGCSCGRHPSFVEFVSV